MSASETRVTLWMIEVFAAIAEERSVSAAARRIAASASTVSQQLTKLEAAVDVRLVDRAARPIALTPMGEVFYRRARNILDEAALARAELSRRDLAHLTRFRLGMIEDFDADVTPRLLTEMAGLLRSCRFLLETGPSHRLLDQLEARALDMVVAADLGTPREAMELHPLLEEPFVAAVPADDSGQPVVADWNGLSRLPLIQYTQRHHMGRQIAAHLARHRLALASRFELDSYHAILSMVASGGGWAILTPLGFLRAPRFEAQVRLVPLPAPPLSRRIALQARRDGMGELPADVACRLRPIIDALVLQPALRRFPWLKGRLRGLDAAPGQVP